MKPNLAKLAALASDPSRGTMLTVLLDGKYHPAGDLAIAAGIKPQTASFHLAKMVEAGIVSMEKYGRHRYYGIAGTHVAEVLENLLSISPIENIKSFREWKEGEALRQGRTCYDHLAGRIGVTLTQALLSMGVITKKQTEFHLTSNGDKFLTDFGIDLDALRKKRRSFSRCCLDWSEREHHLAGSLGNAIFHELLERDWIKQQSGTRAISITEKGRQGLHDVFHIQNV